jgi:hypothetical protein
MVAISNYRSFHQQYLGTLGEDFPINYYVFQEHLSAAQQGVIQLPETVKLFSQLFGPYPFKNEKYAMTQLGF